MINREWAVYVIKDMADFCKGAEICHEMGIKCLDGGDKLEM